MKPSTLTRAFIFVLIMALCVPAQSRFLQVDPVGYGDQLNLYLYVENDPLNRNDPTGQEAGCVAAGGDCGVAGDPVTVGSFMRDMITFFGPMVPVLLPEAEVATGASTASRVT